MSNSTWFGIIGVVALVAGVIFGYTVWHNAEPVQQNGTGTPTAGATFGTQRIAQANVTNSTSTITSILNTDSNTRMIADASFYLANGAATSSNYTITCATSSTQYGIGTNSGNNFVLATTIIPYGFATSTTGAFMPASTSPGIMGTSTTPIGGQGTGSAPAAQINLQARQWASGEYLNCVTTAAGDFNASGKLPTGITGFVSFSYWAQ